MKSVKCNWTFLVDPSTYHSIADVVQLKRRVHASGKDQGREDYWHPQANDSSLTWLTILSWPVLLSAQETIITIYIWSFLLFQVPTHWTQEEFQEVCCSFLWSPTHQILYWTASFPRWHSFVLQTLLAIASFTHFVVYSKLACGFIFLFLFWYIPSKSWSYWLFSSYVTSITNQFLNGKSTPPSKIPTLSLEGILAYRLSSLVICYKISKKEENKYAVLFTTELPVG